VPLTILTLILSNPTHQNRSAPIFVHHPSITNQSRCFIIACCKKEYRLKMMLARRLFAYCLLFQTADVLGSGGWSTGRAGHGNGNPAETVAYETTVTTEMNYYMSEDSSHDTSEDSKSEKKRSNHAEYEYVSAGNPKSGKKGGYYTHAPTHMAVPPHGKGSKNGGHRTHSPTQAAAGKGYGKGKGGSSSSETSSSETSSSEKKSSKKGKGASGKGSKKGGNYPGYTPRKLIFVLT
jgi:hypothetical protein